MIAGIHIVKSSTWRGQTEEFENVYHYDTNAAPTTEAGWNDLVDAIVAIEKQVHAPLVTFARASVHGPTNQTEADDIMRFAKDLSGPGTMTHIATMPKELSIVAQLYMGRSGPPHHRKTFLRKFWHSCALPFSDADAALGNVALSTANRDYFKTRMNNLKTIIIGPNAVDLCKPNGQHIPALTDAVVLAHARTRQFRR